jgi:hypothetical protein
MRRHRPAADTAALGTTERSARISEQMSEYQYYAFHALDRPWAELRMLQTIPHRPQADFTLTERGFPAPGGRALRKSSISAS